MSSYHILYNPLQYNFMDHLSSGIIYPEGLLGYLTRQKASVVNEHNYLSYLNFDSSKERANRINFFPYENYGSYYIANQICAADPSSRVILADGKRRTFKEIILSERSKPGIVFITCMSTNFPAAALAAIVLNRVNIPVVLGGVHVSLQPDDVDTFIRKYAKNSRLVSTVIGAGDSGTLKRIINDWRTNGLMNVYMGGKTIEDGVWGCSDVKELPPIRKKMGLTLNPIKLLLAGKTRVNVTTPYVGCPHSCKFCSIASLPMLRRKFHARSPKDFVEEIREVQKDGVKLRTRYFFFYPDNILLGGKTLDGILDNIIRSRVTMNFTTQVSIEIAHNEELLAKLRRAGASCFFIGFESLDIRNLKHIGKGVVPLIEHSGLGVSEYYARAVKKIQDQGIAILGAFILGLPFDRFDSLSDHTGKEIAEFCRSNNIGLQSTCITALPGSPNYVESQERGTYLYGEPGSVDYFLSLSATDLMESNIELHSLVHGSPLVTAYMAYDCLVQLYSKRNSRAASYFMADKAWKARTYSGSLSFWERLIDTASTFGIQRAMGAYVRFYDSLVRSRRGYKGIFERLWEQERDPEIKNQFADFVSSFRDISQP